MKLKYVLLFCCGIVLFSCKNDPQNLNSDRGQNKSVKVVDEAIPFLNEQMDKMNYQLEAFKIGGERLTDKEIKDFILLQSTKINPLIEEYKVMLKEKGGDAYIASDKYKNELYKLSIADAKDFDNIFVKYYKDFLAINIKELGSLELHNEKVNALKNKYGNELYEEKLFFDLKK